jgi:predicted phosphodiesterase
MRILVVGDAHVDEHQSLRRFKLANKLIKEREPDAVIIIGDFLSMNCLSEWDRNKRATMEGKRYANEINAGNRALDWMLDGTKVKILHYVEGNHENRVPRYLDVDPTFEGHVGIPQDLDLKSRGFVWTPYKQVRTLGGISFTHIPCSGNGKAIGNPNVAQKALKLFHNSVVFGHTHTLDHAAEHRHGSPHLNQALSVGCFFEHVDEYAVGSKTDYWRGLVLLDNYKPNRFDYETFALGRLEREYR